jgi:diguanylate cyclase (GGDEF)-like protein/PAS domain S-box-containing protein
VRRTPRFLLPSKTHLGRARRALAQTRQALRVTRKQAADTQQRFDSLFKHNPDAVYAVNLEGRLIAANPACERVTGYSAAELFDMASLSVLFPEALALARDNRQRTLGGDGQEFEVTIRHKSGRRVDLQVTTIPIMVDGQVMGVYGVARDIALRRRLLDLTRPISATSSVEGQVNLILAALVDVLPYDSGGLYWVDHARRVLRPETLVAANWVSSELDVFEVPLDGSVMGAVALSQSDRGELLNHAELDPRSVYPPGAVVPCEHLVVVPVAVEGRTVGIFYVARRADPPFSTRDFEIVQLFIGHAAAAIEKMHLFEQTRASEARFHHQALHDPLTDLPNRVLLHDRLGQAIASARREQHHEPVALLVLDLDRFKEVNDTLGHHTGDKLLQEVGRRLRCTLRESDTVARLGGDEFAAVLPGADAAAAAVAAAKLQAALDVPMILEGRELSLAASIGIAAFPVHGADADSLLRRADIAMYTAKRAHAGVTTYAPDHDSHSSERLTLVAALRRAIALEELSLHYQPQVDVASGRLAGVEALVRWWHPDRGLILPDQFVPLAEQSGLIRELTRWVLAAALSQSAGWRKLGSGPGLSVNVSSYDLVDERLPEFVAAQLERWRFPAEQLTLEITASALLSDPERAIDVLTRFRKLGVRIALDDFGTGFSSLAYLKVWPLDEVKVDLSLVHGIVVDPGDRAIVRATIELAHSLGLDVVAEGVENAATLRLLEDMGSDRAQGYYLARPMPPSQLVRWCQTELSQPAVLYPAA